ncbi:CGNR zinc finger domain-containing protein [Aeromicrobium sp. NPDC092404]|uniref:CGNR zinc finger domain-containing protein n=1 Tax=Aeromicrobium sp. NPDC092404 TaxID=3154976 RepID=UPI0034264B7D
MEHAFPCGDLSLDFIGTLRARRAEAPTEMLTTPARLDSWFAESRTVDGTTGSRPRDLEAAIRLREAIHDLVSARMAGRTYEAPALDVLNAAASRPPVIPQLDRDGSRTEGSAQQALSTVARDAVRILGGPEAALLKECARPGCTQTYLDTSRGGRREWCAMETCGNKMKAAAYRARKREASAGR